LKYLLDEKLLKTLKKENKIGDILTKRFQSFLVNWVEKEYPHKKAHEVLNIAQKTYYNWKDGADEEPPIILL